MGGRGGGGLARPNPVRRAEAPPFPPALVSPSLACAIVHLPFMSKDMILHRGRFFTARQKE